MITLALMLSLWQVMVLESNFFVTQRTTHKKKKMWVSAVLCRPKSTPRLANEIPSIIFIKKITVQ